MIKAFAALAALASVASALPKPSNANTAMRFIYHNNLNLTDDVNHVGAILLSTPMPYSQAADACGALDENLLNKRTLQQYRADFAPELSYLSYSNFIEMNTQAYFIGDNGVVIATEGLDNFKFASATDPQYSSQSLPVLCTQSDQHNEAAASPPTAQNQLMVRAAGNEYIGYRNKKSFRFAGIKYGQYPARWTYSSAYNVTGALLNATVPGPQCLQYGSGSEDCLYLNIQTPYLPQQSGSGKSKLRPVLFWIHGGGFTGGVGSDPGSDGQQLSSREDVVVVTFNYRLSTLGFLAVPGVLPGNYGIGDQLTALNWVRDNIAKFGGDPTQITINGGSAGAGSVRTLLGSPKAIGKFAGAWAMSNLGGGQSLGLGGNYGTTYSLYDTVNQSFASAGQQIFKQAGCNQATLAAQVDCLRTYKGDLTSFGTVARYVVQDGSIVNTPDLEVSTYNDNVAHIPVIFGITATEGASFVGYNKTCTTEVDCVRSNIGISQYYAEQIVNSGLFPYYNTGNVTADSFNVSSRVTTDNTFRCIDQATMYAASVSKAFTKSYYYQSDRTFYGYNPNNVNQLGPIEPGYPYGDPEDPNSYYHTHGSDMGFWFGGVEPLRDDNDLYALQLYMDYFGSYIRTRDPNTPLPLLQVRNYQKTIQGNRKSGPWNPVSAPTGPIMRLNYPANQATFVDQPQCSFLNYSITYYLDGGK